MTVTLSDGLNSQTLKTAGGGRYALVVRSGWRGTVRPSLSGYYFLPGFAALGPVQRDVVQDFILSPLHAGPLRRISPMMATR